MRRKRDDDDPAFRLEHDPEDALEEGMSDEAAEVDRAETLASTGDADGSFRDIASGSATGVGVDRLETEAQPIRDQALGAPRRPGDPDVDQNDGDDSWLQDLPEEMK